MTLSVTSSRQKTVGQLILQALTAGPMDGAAVLSSLANRASLPGHWDPGALDSILQRLEDRGFVESRWSRVAPRGRVRVYQLTRLGEQRLALAPPDPDGSLAAEADWVSHAIGDTHAVIRLLGRGAVGSVYLALDRV